MSTEAVWQVFGPSRTNVEATAGEQERPVVSHKNYLNRTVELNRYVTADPSGDYNCYWLKGTLWYAAGIALLVAFVALGVGALVATGMFFPLYIPITTIAAIGAAQMIWPVYQMIQANAKYNNDLAAVEHGVVKELELLNVKTNAQLRETFSQATSQRSDAIGEQDLLTMKPALARHEYYRKHIVELAQKAQEQFEKVQKFAQENPNDENTLRANRLRFFELHEEAQKAKTWQAYTRAVLDNPNLQADLSDICDFYTPSFGERSLANAFKDPRGDAFLVLKPKGKEVPPLTTEALNKVSVEELAEVLQTVAATIPK